LLVLRCSVSLGIFSVVSLGKKNKGGRGGGGGGGEDQFDGGSDVDSVSSVSTALSDLQLAQATEQVSSQDFVLDKYIDDLYEKRWIILFSLSWINDVC
jgi:hypothetical protein